MRFSRLFMLVAFLIVAGLLHAKPDRKDDHPKADPVFKPIEIKNELKQTDPNDAKLGKPSKKYTLKLTKDKAYVVDLASSDFDPYVRVLDKRGVQLAEDLDGAGNGTSRLVIAANDSGDHQVVVTSFDGEVGRFVLNVREINLRGEPKLRNVVKTGLHIADRVEEKDGTDLGKFSKLFSVKLKAGQSYLIEAASDDFDPQVYLFDSQSKLLGFDHTRVFHVPAGDGEHRVVLSSFDNKEGKFDLKVRELNIKGEAKPRAVGKAGLKHNDELDEKDTTDLGDYSRVVTVQLKAGQSYLFEIKSSDFFDGQLYIFDSRSKMLAQDRAKVFHVPTANSAYHLLVKSFDGSGGKFELEVQEFNLKGEANPRDLAKGDLIVKGQINANDDTPIGKAGKVYSVQMKAGQTYHIELDSSDLDAYLYLFDAKSTLLAQDDDSGGELNSRVIFRAERDGVYHIIATSLGGVDTGEFTLKVRKRD